MFRYNIIHVNHALKSNTTNLSEQSANIARYSTDTNRRFDQRLTSKYEYNMSEICFLCKTKSKRATMRGMYQTDKQFGQELMYLRSYAKNAGSLLYRSYFTLCNQNSSNPRLWTLGQMDHNA